MTRRMYQGGGGGGSRLGRYEHGEKYMETLTQRSKKLSADTRSNLNSLPKLYAKMDELNRKLASSRLDSDADELNLSARSSQAKRDDIYLRDHKRALLKKTMVVSQCLDEGVKQRLESLKYGSLDPGRRYSMVDMDLLDKLKSSPRLADNDEVNSNPENDAELFSSTTGSGELAGAGKDDVMADFRAGRRFSKSRLSDFACNLSNEGQYALLKSLEDQLVGQLEHSRPELVDKLPPVRTRAEPPVRRTCKHS